MSSTEREIYIRPEYPMPRGVEGAFFVDTTGERDEDDSQWYDAELEDFSSQLSVGDEDESDPVQTPILLSIEYPQTMYIAPGGNAVVDAILLIQEVEGVEDYDIRVTVA